MAISRPFLLAVLGALLLGVTGLAVQNARTASDGDAAPAVLQTKAAPAAPAPTTAAGPEQTLNSAFNLGELDSGRFTAEAVFSGGSGPAAGKFAVSGAFETTGAKEMPKFDIDVRLSAGKQSVGGGLVSLGDKAYFVRGNNGWRVPAAVWTPLVSNLAAGGAGQQKLPLNLHPGNWVRDVKSEGTDSVAGVKAEHVSARVDPKAVFNDLAQAVQSNGVELPDTATVSRLVRKASLDVWVGSDDHILRRLSAEVVFAGRGRLNLDVRLSDVNEPQQIEAPAHVRAGAPGGALGQVASALVGGINGITGQPDASLASLTSPNPRRAARAVRAHKKVVIVFRNPRGLDDRAMAPVIRNLESRTNALVLTDEVDAVERYGKLVEDLGVSQTPSVVIIDRSGKAQLLEGYVDSDTLTQAVADAR
jgi:hypothetical protein